MERKPTFLETLAIEHDKSIARQLLEERRRRLFDQQTKGPTIEETMGKVWDYFQGSDRVRNLFRLGAWVETD